MEYNMIDHLPANLNDQEAHEPYYEDSRAMMLSHYVMAERCLQVESYKIYEDFKEGDYATLTYILEGGFRGFHKMSREDLEDEYKEIEDKWYELEADKGLYWEAYEDDPIWNITERDTKEFVDRLGKI
jgi:hypothetical protein|tara:strand:+ start:1701 stop:2084 length:384 start_codon:yes stop_codon:yes gene_type:complete